MAEIITNEKALLDRYFTDNKKFNIFKVLKLENMEIRHSNFLAWLLNPQENHGLGRCFFDYFCQIAGITSYFDEINIVRESEGNIDILIKDGKAQNFIIIENKYGTKEHSNQLEKYYNYVRTKYNVDNNCINKIYLDLDDELTIRDKDYIPITYEKHILPILEKIVPNMQDNSPEQQAVKQYIAILKEKYELRGELKNICLNIHKDGQYSSEYSELINKMLEHRRYEIIETLKNILSMKYYMPEQKSIYRVIFAKNENDYNSGHYYEFDNTNTINNSEIKLYEYTNNSKNLITIIDEDSYNEIFYQTYNKMRELLALKLKEFLSE